MSFFRKRFRSAQWLLLAGWVAAFCFLVDANGAKFHETAHFARKYSAQQSKTAHLDYERCLICDTLQVSSQSPQVTVELRCAPLVARAEAPLESQLRIAPFDLPFGARAPPAA